MAIDVVRPSEAASCVFSPGRRGIGEQLPVLAFLWIVIRGNPIR